MNNPVRQVTKFVLLTTQRSGSTFIRLWLNSHPNVRCHSEVFYRKYRAADGFRSYCEANKAGLLFYHALDKRGLRRLSRNLLMRWIIERFLDELYTNPLFSAPWTDMTSDTWTQYQPRENLDLEKIVGFQLMYDQLAFYSPLQEWMTNHNVAIIHLIRQNALKKLLSGKVATKTGQFHFARNGSRPKIVLDPRTIITQLDEIVDKRETMKKKFPGNPYLEITYEQFFSDYSKDANKIFALLELEVAEMEFPKFLRKLNPDSVEDLIENYDEIAAVLKGTRYQGFLE
jgi:LPS sulfotransferase NodH